MNNKKTVLNGIVGSSNVFDTPEILAEYSKDKSFAKSMAPDFMVKVQNAEEVQALVRWARETKTPLIPISSGGPHFKGDTVPNVPGAVIVDLSGMKKILGISKKHRIVHVEPGVTYGELNMALAKEGLQLSAPLAPRANKSVLTSVLDVEPRLNPRYQWQYTEPLRSMEVVWGDGVRVFTGSGGGGPLNLEMQWAADNRQVSGMGPFNVDFIRFLTQSQGTMGIITWAALKCQVMPKVHKLFIVPAKKLEDLTGFIYKVLQLRFGDELLIVNGACLASLLGEDSDRVRELKGILPPWAALVGVCGRDLFPEKLAEQQELDIGDIAQQNGLSLATAIPGAKSGQVLDKILMPSGEKHWKETCKGAFQDIFFVTTLDKTDGFIGSLINLSASLGYPATDVGIYIQPQFMGTSVSVEFNLPYNPENAAETALVKELFTKASVEFSRQGAFYSRPHGMWSKLQLNKDAQNYHVLKKIKEIFDPDNIMNTGKLCVY